jgi:hypothetical protein
VIVIKPLTITDTMLVSSNVAETDYAEFLMDTTYGDGDTRIVTTGVEVLTLDVAPATAWVAGRLITGQTSAVTSRVVAQLTALTYQIRERTGVYTLGEVIGVTGTGAELADQGPTYPRITEILRLDVAPATDWAAADVLTGQTSTFTCIVVAKLTKYTYSVHSRTGAFTLGEVIGVTGTAAKLADQGATYPTFIPSSDGVHKIYESLVAGNKSNYPPTDVLAAVPKWLEVSSTNRWKMFDLTYESQTSNADIITVTLTPGEICDSVVLLNLEASRITIVVTDPTDGEVYNQTIFLEASETVVWGTDEQWGTDEVWQGGSYIEIIEKVGLKLDLPPYTNASITITILSADATAKCGTLIIGRKKTLGITEWSPSVGIIDYSIKEADTFGNFSVVARAYSKRASCVFAVNTVSHVEVLRLLTLYRTTPLIWILSDDYNTTIVYGFYKEFTISLGHTLSECDINIEGMT